MVEDLPNICENGVYEPTKGNVHCSLDAEVCFWVFISQDGCVRESTEGQRRCGAFVEKLTRDVIEGSEVHGREGKGQGAAAPD